MKQELTIDGDPWVAESKETVQDILLAQQPTDFWRAVTVDEVFCGPGSREGDNYMSIIKRVVAHCTVKMGDGSDHAFTISLIFKRQITNDNRRKLFRCDAAFESEITAYTCIIPVLQKIAPYKLPYPDCLAAGSDDRGERVVLKDLTTRGYSMVDRRVGLSFVHCSAVITELAKVHATSLALKFEHPAQYATVCAKVREIVFCPEATEFYTHSLETSLRGALDSLRYSDRAGDLEQPIQAIEQGLTGRLYQIMAGLVCDLEDESWSVICHGDTWINNLMFSSDLQSVRLVDLQTMRCTTPVIDILHLLYTSTVLELRQKYTTDLLLLYRRELMKALARHLSTGGEQEPRRQQLLRQFDEQFSYVRLRAEYDRCILYGLGIAMWLLPAVTFSPNQILNLDGVTISDFKSKNHEKRIAQMVSVEYHTRMRDIALELYDQGALQRLAPSQ
ncbi:uncharacterized protein LOC131212356 [Anopheles bellator]|uniref:uncharacterized protein LOC131212356 n=1 Tax=Anopheles bellator TaxID=139047 RepID=UPI0026497578|nr:uncharacterized protein LOC131212356 [Anopheles bellator]